MAVGFQFIGSKDDDRHLEFFLWENRGVSPPIPPGFVSLEEGMMGSKVRIKVRAMLVASLAFVMASPRKSRRLNGEPPEITITKFRCICLLEGQTCDLRAMQLSCCGQFCHRQCLKGWRRRGNQTCPFCRQSPAVPPENQDPLDTLAPVPGHLSREEVIQRLDQLLSNPDLRQEIERVSNVLVCCFILFSDHVENYPSRDVEIEVERVTVTNGVPDVVVNGYFFA